MTVIYTSIAVLLAGCFRLAQSAGLDKDELRLSAVDLVAGKGEPANLDKKDFAKVASIIHDKRRDEALILQAFNDLAVNGKVHELNLQYYCEALGHLLKEKYFKRLNWKLQEGQIEDLFNQHTISVSILKKRSITFDKFKELIPKLFKSDVNPDWLRPKSWYNVLNSDGQVTFDEILNLCKNTADWLLDDLVKEKKEENKK